MAGTNYGNSYGADEGYGWPWTDGYMGAGTAAQPRQLAGTVQAARPVQAQIPPQALPMGTVQARPQQAQPVRQDGKDDDEYNTPEKMLRNGVVMQAYGKTDMVSVNLAPNIHMVRWSAVKLKTGGREHVDFWMKMDDMRRLCSEILNGTAGRRIAADQSKYPSAYRYVGGQDGCRELNIGKGQKGVLLQVREKDAGGAWRYRMLAVSYSALQDMAFYFNLVMGLTPVTPGTYYEGLVKAYYEGEKYRNSLHGRRAA